MKHPFLALTGLIFATSAWASNPAPAVATKGDPAKAQNIVDKVCGACHGADGNSTSPTYPNLAGQQPEYIYKQLTEFKSGARKNAIMAPNVTALSNDDMLNLAAYFSSQQPKPKLAKDAALAAEGGKLYKGGNAGSGRASLRFLPWPGRLRHPGAISAPCRAAFEVCPVAVEELP
jgi:cytochrome c553